MANTRLSTATYVERGYGQVEPNHLSAQRTGQIYAQLPADADIDVLENGQFVKYDYSTGLVNFTGKGEWMLVYNEIKLYRDHMADNDFALLKTDYNARVYSPIDGVNPTSANARDYHTDGTAHTDPYEPDTTDNPFVITKFAAPKNMPTGTKMVPRVFKTNIGDIFTTNTVKETTLALGDILTPGTDGFLRAFVESGESADPETAMQWEVVKVYTLPDRQKAVKIMRIV